ncbi:MAG TPA: FAD-linked oxidase C-terminal domain-containing protein [Thermodesulfovibrionia bacterium]|nr:FAD-linked oxidase C-terminal domain-containing protein [Thermodesulfovibrionia bacterium]
MKIKKLKALLPERVFTEPEVLCCYSFDASPIRDGNALAVVRPKSVDECVKAVQFCFDNNVPLCPRGAGTGTTGGSVSLNNAVILSLEAMNRVLEVDEKNSLVVVEPGVINSHLQRELAKKKLFYPPDPASMAFCTLGGNVAENAAGPRGIKYGVTRDYVMGLEVVMPDGTVMQTGVKTHKGVVGYDLTRLIVGSEGTLAVITKIFLKILPLPEKVVTLLAVFQNMVSAAQTVTAITGAGIVPAALEFMDREAIMAVERYQNFGLPAQCEAMLLIELDGSSPVVEKEADRAASICTSFGASVTAADTQSSREQLWKARRAISPALYFISPSKINEDIVVPRTRLADILNELRKISETCGVPIVSFGHAGDGNIHVNIMTDRNNPEEYGRAKGAVKKIFEATLRMGGTISGEHGIGLTKKPYIGMEIPRSGINLMKGIKELFDPKGILNPGKIFP